MRYDVDGKDGVAFPKYPDSLAEFPDGFHTEDATGASLSPLRWCDTETGEAVRYVVGTDGKFAMNPDQTVKTVRGTYPAPLRLAPGPGPKWGDGSARSPYPPDVHPVTTPHLVVSEINPTGEPDRFNVAFVRSDTGAVVDFLHTDKRHADAFRAMQATLLGG